MMEATPPNTPKVRLHYMDNLRALAMMAGVLFHCALAYSPFLQDVWLTADISKSSVVDVFAFFMHLFRMPLFFVVAGFFAALLVERRGLRAMIINRSKRILLPFVIFLPLCTVAVIGLSLWALGVVENRSTVLERVYQATMHPTEDNQMPISTMHLWFLYMLMYFYCIYGLVSRFVPASSRAAFISIKPRIMIVSVFFILLLCFFVTSAPHSTPESLKPNIWSMSLYGTFFGFGVWFYFNSEYLETLKRYWLLLLIVSILVYAVLFFLFPEKAVSRASLQVDYTFKHAFLAILETIVSLSMTLTCMYLGYRYLSQRNRVLAFISDSSYWVYLIHIPIIFAIQYPLMDRNWGVVNEFMLTTLLTLIVCFSSYILFVRWTPVGLLLNGKRRPFLR
ncbi:acyltransferase family protein [Teredinibacter sp. KSP-S5-2]|uniref:acyltransferase family protein n=1 Tax=Teredinibacter sp. KSP-S5-2 TaxID=3034506 RepID=UPI00293503AE|nr:acyltransferase family protein [Teredinibacter sp. KSP-S5-2]WNO07753.1 acyltransferase family protein [Teredinibacter sp. KSP-S5-2]